MLAKKIITAKQMRTYRAKNSSVMKDLLSKGGDQVVRRKVYQKEFWNALRSDSKSHEFGERGYTKKGLTTFMGKMLANQQDSFTNRKVKKLADLWGIKRNKLYVAAAEARVQQNREKAEQRQFEVQKHEQAQVQRQQYEQREGEIRGHIGDIIAKGVQRSRQTLSPEKNSLTNHGHNDVITHGQGDEQKSNNAAENTLTKFGVSDSNVRKYESTSHIIQKNTPQEQNSQAFGHVLFLKNKQHNFVAEEDLEVEKAKARLARIQGASDNNIVAE
jgi:hypothetical protein